mmetsp:Transcript_24075/g.47799  ORF Transcript_24075/g.47799 Transcript_24075/m.47799 type:complete len:298 (-) Transcript_24075:346-1239(-)
MLVGTSGKTPAATGWRLKFLRLWRGATHIRGRARGSSASSATPSTTAAKLSERDGSVSCGIGGDNVNHEGSTINGLGTACDSDFALTVLEDRVVYLNLGLRTGLKLPYHFSSPTDNFSYNISRHPNISPGSLSERKRNISPPLCTQHGNEIPPKINLAPLPAIRHKTRMTLRDALVNVNATPGAGLEVTNHLSTFTNYAADIRGGERIANSNILVRGAPGVRIGDTRLGGRGRRGCGVDRRRVCRGRIQRRRGRRGRGRRRNRRRRRRMGRRRRGWGRIGWLGGRIHAGGRVRGRCS